MIIYYFSNLSYLGMYQDKEKKLELYKGTNIYIGLEPNKKTDKMVVYVSPSTLEFSLNIHTEESNGHLVE